MLTSLHTCEDRVMWNTPGNVWSMPSDNAPGNNVGSSSFEYEFILLFRETETVNDNLQLDLSSQNLQLSAIYHKTASRNLPELQEFPAASLLVLPDDIWM
ncbi:hypothetical protein TNCV_2164811 [Trichonephila clavipes]|nr:hypothetical protein TNCV_2164811 [Trichonephila clavipes]